MGKQRCNPWLIASILHLSGSLVLQQLDIFGCAWGSHLRSMQVDHDSVDDLTTSMHLFSCITQ